MLKNMINFYRSAYKKIFERASAIALGASVIIVIILITASLGKIFFPANLLSNLDLSIGIFEICFSALLIVWSRSWKIWIAASLIFASWFGYSIYWFTIELPCNCMGKMISLPTGLTISLDLMLFLASLFLAHLLGAKKNLLLLTILCGLLFAFAGGIFGKWVFNKMVLTNEKLVVHDKNSWSTSAHANFS